MRPFNRALLWALLTVFYIVLWVLLLERCGLIPVYTGPNSWYWAEFVGVYDRNTIIVRSLSKKELHYVPLTRVHSGGVTEEEEGAQNQATDELERS